jgi:ketosteroid isomerase-like protein
MLTPRQMDYIKSAVTAAADAYLYAADAETVLDLYTADAWAVTNETVFPNRAALAEDIRTYFDQVLRIDEAAWDDVRVHIMDATAATFTARLRYGYTDRNGESHRLTGAWTALFVRDNGAWKIRLRNESLEPQVVE